MFRIIKNKFLLENISRFLITCFLAMLFLEPLIPAQGMLIASDDNSTCLEQLDQAENYYYDGKIELAINLTMQCLKNKNIDDTIKIRAFKILVRTQLAREDIQSAKQFVNKILDLNPSYQPTIEEEIPQMVNIVTEIKKEREKLNQKPEEQGGTNWFWIGAGGVAAVTVFALVISGNGNKEKKEDEQKELPTPPVFP